MNLVDALTSGDAEYALLTTFPFDTRFYQEYLSRELSSAGVVSPVILMDHDRYQQNLANGTWQPGSIQGDYYLEPVDVPGTFHPKVVVTASDDQVHVAVSSANLTLSEMTSAVQLGTQVTVNRDEETPDEHVSVVQDVLSFVETLTERYVGRDGAIQLGRLTDAASWVTEHSPADVPDTRFVHNLTTPILPQVVEQFGEVEILQLAAPFFGSPNTVAEIVEEINPDECELLVDDGTTYIDLEGVIDAIGCPVTVRRLEYSSSRWVHAKFLCVNGPGRSGCLYGSPNQTGQALLSDADSGNIEAGVLRIEESPSYFSDGSPLFDSNAFSVQLSEPVSIESLTTNSYSEIRSTEDSTSTNIHIEDVFVQTESKNGVQLELVLSAAPDLSIRKMEATLHALEDESHHEISWQEHDDPETDTIRGTVSAPSTWRNTVVYVELADGHRSDYRQVTVEPTPYTRSQSEMNVTGGRKGVRELIWNLIFMNDSRAGESLSTSARSLQRRLEDSTRGGSQLVEGTGSSWTIGRRRSSGGSSRAPHHQLRDSLELSKTNLQHFIAQPPDPDYVQEVVEHLENYWLALEAGYIRSVLSDQLASNNEMALQFDPDDLLAVVRKYYSALHSEQILRRTGEYLFEGLANAPNEHATYLDGDLAFECLFAHPALILGLDTVADETGVPPFFFTQDVFHTLSNSQPLIAEQLLDPQAITERYSQLLKRYENGVKQLAENCENSLTLPPELKNTHKCVLYTVWYQELTRHSEGLFGQIGQCERYHCDALKQLGSLMIQGREHLDSYKRLSEFRDGSLDDIAQKYFGSETGTSGREQQIEALADGTYW